MKTFITGAIKKSRTSLSILVLLALSGIFALNYLPKATEPQVSFPGAYIGVGFEGVSPEDSERLLAKPLEDALRTISGVVDIRSTSATGYAAVVVEFDLDVDIDDALYDVRVKVDEARALIEQGWALHKELEDTPDDSRHYDALELLFQALDILEAT